jgi:hypothetical protein
MSGKPALRTVIITGLENARGPHVGTGGVQISKGTLGSKSGTRR